MVLDRSIVERAITAEEITQAYFVAVEGFAIRVRLTAHYLGDELVERATLTGKGPRINTLREEFNADTSLLWARQMIARADIVMRKRRHQVPVEHDQTWEIDEFLDANSGLWIAELEGGESIKNVKKPEWALKEIVNEPRLDNENLAIFPISKWSYEDRLWLAAPGW